jgi:hypothetical protein
MNRGKPRSTSPNSPAKSCGADNGTRYRDRQCRYAVAFCRAQFCLGRRPCASWEGSCGRNRGGREAVAGEIRPDNHDDIKSRGRCHRYGRAQRLDCRRWRPDVGRNERGRLLLQRGVVDRCRRYRRSSVLRSGNGPSSLLELLGEVGAGVGLFGAVGDENLHS